MRKDVTNGQSVSNLAEHMQPNQPVVVYALPRDGGVLGVEVARVRLCQRRNDILAFRDRLWTAEKSQDSLKRHSRAAEVATRNWRPGPAGREGSRASVTIRLPEADPADIDVNEITIRTAQG